MMLKLRFYNDPILRKRAQEITEITSEIKQIAQDMIDTMDHFSGIGLAGNQAGVLLRIFVVREEKRMVDGTSQLGDPIVYINPKLSNPSEEKSSFDEGCLSLPGFTVPVERPVEIDIEYQDLEGKFHKKRLKGLNARVAMHEHDHLNGTLHIDRIGAVEKKKVQQQLRNLKKQHQQH